MSFDHKPSLQPPGDFVCRPQATERETPEGSPDLETISGNQPSTSETNQPSSSTTDLDQVLRDARASLMKSIPDLDASDTREAPCDTASGQMNSSVSKSDIETPLDLTTQGRDVTRTGTLELSEGP